VYSDAVDDFPDSGPSQGVKQNLQQEHILNSGTLLMSSESFLFIKIDMS